MSGLHRSIMKNKLPPKCPRSTGSKMAPFGGSRRKDYSPLPWHQYFHKFEDVVTEGGVFRVYMSPEPDQPDRPRIVTLHGGGYSGLSWALFTQEITNMIHCQVLSMDVRGHGETQASDPHDLSIETLTRDVEALLTALYPDQLPPLVLLGHSMGGAVATRVAHSETLAGAVQGLAVIDVVEGTAMEALASMQSFLRSRPTHFRSLEHAIEWCVRSGQVRNVESARVSMPGQIINCATNRLAINEVDSPSPQPEGADAAGADAAAAAGVGGGMGSLRADSIAEEEESEFARPLDPAPGPAPADMKYAWRIHLSKTEQHWPGWFRGLSAAFLAAPAPRLLLLASVDGLDRELTQGQMQGKFQMQVLPRCGHAVHEDCPEEVGAFTHTRETGSLDKVTTSNSKERDMITLKSVARVVAAFAIRHRLTCATEQGGQMNLVSAPGC